MTLSERLFPSIYPDFVYNFAYGSNMSPKVLSGRRKIHPIESTPGILEGWQLTFDLRGIPAVEPCFGNIKENGECEVHGILHRMTGSEFRQLLASEGGAGVDPNGYIPHEVSVKAYDGRTISAYALVVHQTSPMVLLHHTLPSARYVSLLCQGATHYGIHPLYIEYLQSLPSHKRSTPVMLLVIAVMLLLIVILAPIWIPVVFYGMVTNRTRNARTFFFTLIMANVWRVYRLFTSFNVIQPYSSASFPLGSTKLQTDTSVFRAEVQSDEQTFNDSMMETSAETRFC